MADKKISALPSAGSLSGTELVPIVQGGITKNVSAQTIANVVSNSTVIGKVLTGYTSGAGTVAATDTILQAIQKLNGNIAAVPTGLTVGTTTITGGTNTKVLYNNNGVVGEYTVTGSGSAVLNDSPIIKNGYLTPSTNAGKVYSLRLTDDGSGTVNPDLLIDSIFNSRIRLLNNTSSVQWYFQNNVTIGAELDTFNIGISANPLSSFFKIYPTGLVNVSKGATFLSYATTGTNGYGAYFNATTGATNNFSAGFNSLIQASGLTLNGYTATALNYQTGVGIIGTQFVSNGGLSLAARTSSDRIGFLNNGVGGTELWRMAANGNFSNNGSDGTARIHLKAGTATASTAPLKLTSGTNLTTPENGAFEYDGTNLYFTTGGVRKTVTLV